MSESETRFDLIERNYMQANQNYLADVARTRTVEAARAIEINLLKAELAWVEAVEAQLDRNNPELADLTVKLKAAHEAVLATRKTQQKLQSLIDKMRTATDLATRLVRAAAKV